MLDDIKKDARERMSKCVHRRGWSSDGQRLARRQVAGDAGEVCTSRSERNFRSANLSSRKITGRRKMNSVLVSSLLLRLPKRYLSTGMSPRKGDAVTAVDVRWFRPPTMIVQPSGMVTLLCTGSFCRGGGMPVVESAPGEVAQRDDVLELEIISLADVRRDADLRAGFGAHLVERRGRIDVPENLQRVGPRMFDDAGDQLVVEHADAARLDDDVGGAALGRARSRSPSAVAG